MLNKDARIYVAGHKGLVGSAIYRALRAGGYSQLIARSSQELDLRNPAAVQAFFAAEQPEYVFLAAAKVGGIVANNVYRGEFLYDNLMIQSNVMEAARLAGVKKLLFLGSTCIYPREAEQPMREEALLTSPLEYTNEPYAIAKIAGMKLCESYNLQYGTNFIAVMPTNLYGLNDNFDLEKSHVLPALLRKMHLGRALELGDWQQIRSDLDRNPLKADGLVDGSATEAEIRSALESFGVAREKGSVRVEIWGSGRPRREFLWSDDLAEACVYLMQKIDFSDIVSMLELDREVRNAHLNIGTGQDVSIRELAELIKREVGFGGELYFNADKPDGTFRKLTDPGRLHALGWRHKVELDEGIRRMYAWYTQS